MSNIVSFSDFKKKRQKDPDFKVELNKKKVKDIQESLRRINDLMREIKADARRQIDALDNKGKKDV
jgi:signal transduction histidine kinase